MTNDITVDNGTRSRRRSSLRSRRTRRAASRRSTAFTPRPGTRNSISRGARFRSTGKRSRMRERPCELGIEVEPEHAALRRNDLLVREAVVAHQPVGLVEAVLARQRRRLQRQGRRGVGNGAERRVVHAAQAVGAVQPGAGREDGAIVGGVRADDHLGALPRGRERCGRTAAGRYAGHRDGLGGRCLFRLRACLVDLRPQPRHRAADGLGVLLGGERGQALHRRQLDVDAQPVGVAAGALQQLGRRVRNGLEMDVAAEVVRLAQHTRDLDDLLHGVVGAADDPRAQKQSLDAVAAVEVERERHHLVDREAGARHVAADAVDAVEAVVAAIVGEQHLEQRDAAAVGRKAVADAVAVGGADPAAAGGVAFRAAAGSAGRVVLGRVGEDGELLLNVHWMNIQ